MDKQILGDISLACATVGYGSYIWSTLRKGTKPHAFSWGVWSLIMAIVFFAQTSRGGAAGAWATGYSAIFCFIIFVLALSYGEKNIVRSDWFALAGALTTIPVWYFTHEPLWAVILATLIDAFAYYPTLRKSWLRPYEENYFLYTVDDFKWVAAFFAFDTYSAVTLLYPAFLFSSNVLLVAVILVRRRYVKRQS